MLFISQALDKPPLCKNKQTEASDELFFVKKVFLFFQDHLFKKYL